MPMTITVDDTIGQAILALAAQLSATGDSVPVHVDYKDVRTHGLYDKSTGRITITSGPLHSKIDRTTSGAAVAVVSHYSPDVVKPDRNGWTFWRVTATGLPLQSIRGE